jgi:hypothetical protein
MGAKLYSSQLKSDMLSSYSAILQKKNLDREKVPSLMHRSLVIHKLQMYQLNPLKIIHNKSLIATS